MSRFLFATVACDEMHLLVLLGSTSGSAQSMSAITNEDYRLLYYRHARKVVHLLSQLGC